LRRLKASAGDAENLPPQRWSLSLTERSLHRKVHTHRGRSGRDTTCATGPKLLPLPASDRSVMATHLSPRSRIIGLAWIGYKEGKS
jgi:hypothetical protein